MPIAPAILPKAGNSGVTGQTDLLEKFGVYNLRLNPDRKLVFGFKAGGAWRSVISAAALPIDAWAHVAATYDSASGRAQIFIDGAVSGALTGPVAALNDVPAVLQTGSVRNSPSRTAAFSIDDLRLYGRALSAGDVGLLFNRNDPALEANQDWDTDGLNNLEEYLYGTNPNSSDSDGDHLNDHDEVYVHDTAPRLKDTDGDRLDDDVEVALGTNPTDPDSDDDDLWDGEETGTYNTAPKDSDTDNDGLPDGWEVEHSFDSNHYSDASGNPDGDAMTNLQEYQNGTNPHFDEATDLDVDSDFDGISNYLESVYYHTDPNNAHTYDPNVSDYELAINGLLPGQSGQTSLNAVALAAPATNGGNGDGAIRKYGALLIAVIDRRKEHDARGGPCTAKDIDFGSHTVQIKHHAGEIVLMASQEDISKLLVVDKVILSGVTPEGASVKSDAYSAPGTPLPGKHAGQNLGANPMDVFEPGVPIDVTGFINKLKHEEDGSVTVTIKRTYWEKVKNCGGGGGGGGGGGSGGGGGGGGGWGGWGWNRGFGVPTRNARGPVNPDPPKKRVNPIRTCIIPHPSLCTSCLWR